MNAENNTTNRSGIQTVFFLLLLLLLTLPQGLIFVGRPSPARSMEGICTQTSLETWLRVKEGEPMAWWNPTWDGGVIRIEKPPMRVWLNLLAWHRFSPDSVTMEQLAFGSRLMTMITILISLSSVFWIGLRLCSRYAACLAALATGTFFLTIKQAHYATYDAQLMGWATLAVAIGIQAISSRNRKARSVAAWLFWVLSGLALGATLMTKGPVGAVWVLGPLILALALLSKNPGKDTTGFLVAALIGGLILTPWLLHTLELQSGALSSLADEYKPVDEDQFRPMYYYAGILAFVFPWTFWWVASWFHPFKNREGGKARFFPLAWFLLSFVFLCAWPMRNQRYLVPLLPAAGLMCAVYLDQVIRTESMQRIPHRLLRIFWGIAIALSLVVPVLIALQPWLLAHELIDELQVEGIPGWGCLAGAAILLLLAAAGWRQSVRPLRKAAFILVGLWMTVLATFGYYGYSQAGHQLYHYQEQAEDMALLTSGSKVYYLYEHRREHPPKPAIGFTLHALKILYVVTPEKVPTLMQNGQEFFLLVPDDSTSITPQSEGFQNLGSFEDDDRLWNLLRYAAPAPTNL